MTAFSGLFDTIQPTGHTLTDTKPLEKRTSKLFRNEGYRKLRELMLTTNGVAVGQAALSEYSRIAPDNTAGNAPGAGGQRTIDTISVVDRVSATADTTRIAAMLNEIFVPSSYPSDASGNGGGGQLAEQQTL